MRLKDGEIDWLVRAQRWAFWRGVAAGLVLATLIHIALRSSIHFNFY